MTPDQPSKPSDTQSDFGTEAIERLNILVPRNMQEWAIISPIIDHVLQECRLDAQDLAVYVQAKNEMSHLYDLYRWQQENQKEPIL